MNKLINKVFFTTSNEKILEEFLQPGIPWAFAFVILKNEKVSKELKEKASLALKRKTNDGQKVL